MFPPDPNGPSPPPPPPNPSMPYNLNTYTDSVASPNGPNTAGIYVGTINGVAASGVSATTISITTNSEVDPYVSGLSNLGYHSVIFFYNSINQVPGSIQSYNPGGNTTTITPNSLISSGATNTAIGTPLYILYYSAMTYTNSNYNSYTLPSQFNPGVGSSANPGGLQMGYIFTILPCNEPTPIQQTSYLNNQIPISWSAPTDNGGGALGNPTSYIVQYNTTGNAPWIQVNTQSSSTNYTLSGVTNGTNYYFQVAAVNGYCNNGGPTSGPFSTTFSGISPITPDAPTNLVATPGLQSVSLTWDAPLNNGGVPITSYTVQYRIHGTSPPTWTTASSSISGATPYYVLSGLQNGTEYDFQVAATIVVGVPGPYSEIVTATTFAVPDAPTNLVATPGLNSVSLTWDAPLNDGGTPIISYTVQYRINGTPTWTTASSSISGATPYYVLSGLQNGTEYDFQVAATNAVGTGPYSAIVTATTFAVPDAPTNLVATPGLQSVSLTWDAPLNDGGTPITTYTVQGRVSGTSPWQSVTTIPNPIMGSTPYCVVTQINGNALTDGTLYDFQVYATNVVGTGPYSAIVTATTFAVPDAPTNLVATPGLQSVSLTWDAPLNDGGTPIISYTVQYRIHGTSPPTWTTASSSISGATPYYVLSGLQNGTEYDFQVAATNAVGTGPYSAIGSLACSQTTFAVPDAPTNLVATPGLQSVSLTWDAPLNDGGTPITLYTVQYRLSGIGSFVNAPTTPTPIPGSTPYCIVTGLAPGTTYDFRVAATNMVGTGPYSAIATASTYAVPDAPTGLTAQSGLNSVTLTWNPPASDGGSPITSYTVQYRINGTPTWTTTLLNVIPVVIPPLNYNDPVTLQYIVTGLQNATLYDFEVAAVNASGTGPYSAIVTASTYAVPDAPIGLTAQSGVRSVSLTWLPPLSDGGTPITSYTVQCRVSGIGSFASATTVPTPIPLTPVPLHCIVTQINGTDLLDGTLYDFRVAAVNAAGTGAYASITESTDAVPDAPISLTGTPGNAQVTLYWTAPTNDGGTPITNYLVEFKLDTSATWTAFSHAPSAATTIVVTGLTNGSFYDFRVSAINAIGTGPPSNIFETMPISAIQYNKCGIKGFVPAPPPWSRAGGNNCPNCDSNYGTSACGDTIKPYSTYDLDERRKVEILKYKINSAQLSVAQQYTMLSRNALTRKKTWATQTQTYTNPNVNNLPERESEGVTVALECRRPPVLYSLTSECDVPGPVIPLYIDAKIPLYNYKMQVTPSSGGKQVNKWFDLASLNNN